MKTGATSEQILPEVAAPTSLEWSDGGGYFVSSRMVSDALRPSDTFGYSSLLLETWILLDTLKYSQILLDTLRHCSGLS